MVFSEALKKTREEIKLSQKVVCELTKIPKRTLEDWERGLRTPPEWVQMLVLEKLRTLTKDTAEPSASDPAEGAGQKE